MFNLRILCFFLLSISLSANAQLRSEKDLVGKWVGEGVKIDFFSDGRTVVQLPGGSLPYAKYKTNFFQMPAILSITITDNKKQIVYTASIEFSDNKTLKVQGLNNTGPAFMNGKTIILQKQ